MKPDSQGKARRNVQKAGLVTRQKTYIVSHISNVHSLLPNFFQKCSLLIFPILTQERVFLPTVFHLRGKKSFLESLLTFPSQEFCNINATFPLSTPLSLVPALEQTFPRRSPDIHFLTQIQDMHVIEVERSPPTLQNHQLVLQ